MPSIRHQAGFSRPRSTVKLTGTQEQTKVSLDDRSVFALSYGQTFLQAAGGLTVPPAGVVRRALALYMAHLTTVEDPALEFSCVQRACLSRSLVPEDRHEVTLRLDRAAEAAKAGAYPEPFKVLTAPPGAVDVALVTLKAEAMLKEAHRNQFIRNQGA